MSLFLSSNWSLVKSVVAKVQLETLLTLQHCTVLLKISSKHRIIKHRPSNSKNGFKLKTDRVPTPVKSSSRNEPKPSPEATAMKT